MPLRKILIANRGAVAARIIRTVHAMGREAVCVYSEADATLPYLSESDESFCIGPGPARESYLNAENILAVARKAHADALHPGYGFLSENPEFARRVRENGIVFIGPNPDLIEIMGHKTNARDLVASHGMPVGKAARATVEQAEQLGYPVLVKPAAGGGGIGMTVVRSPEELEAAVERAQSLADRAFGNAEVYLERFVDKPRHVEFQIIGDGRGNVAHLFERDCSIQRRHQKVIEEAPAPAIAPEDIAPVLDRVLRVVEHVRYDNIGTVEMLYSPDTGFQFLEMNTRLQVEHGVTEAVTGVDLVKAQIEIAEGRPLLEALPKTVSLRGHAIEARVYAEDPIRFLPSPGKLEVFRPPASQAIRIETGYGEGAVVTPFYDPLLAKVIAWGESRHDARRQLIDALEAFEISGLKHNVPALVHVLASDSFCAGSVHTELLSETVVV